MAFKSTNGTRSLGRFAAIGDSSSSRVEALDRFAKARVKDELRWRGFNFGGCSLFGCPLGPLLMLIGKVVSSVKLLAAAFIAAPVVHLGGQ